MQRNLTSKASSPDKKSRTSKPKVRTGCSTCKRRRVKCDETKPQCTRCRKFGVTCDGYESDKPVVEPRARRTESERRPLLPKSASPVLDLWAQPSETLFVAEKDSFYFQLFPMEASKGTFSTYEISNWSQIVLQSSYHHPFIRHAIITIGCLNTDVTNPLNQTQLTTSSTGFDIPQCLTAEDSFGLKHYHKFLEAARRALKHGTQSRRIILIVCLLIIRIETLQYHYLLALDHIYGGMHLIQEWNSTTRSRPKSRNLRSNVSPEIDPIEDEIVQQFKELEMEALLISSPRPYQRGNHEKLRFDGLSTIQSMPQLFTSLKEARLYLHLISSRLYHFIGWLRPDRASHPYEKPEVMSPTFLRIYLDALEPFEQLSESLRIEQKLYANELTQWANAFDPLFSSKPDVDQDYSNFLLLKLGSKILMIVLYGELTSTELIYDKFLPEFTEILSLCRIVFSRIKPNEKGSLDSITGLLHPLRLIVDKCRDRRLRREGLEIFHALPWPEECWWGPGAARLGDWVMNIEEEGVEGDFIPEWARVRLLEVDIYEEQNAKKVRIRCVRGVGDNAEEIVANEEGQSLDI